jgi:hypothetical protein
MGQRRLRWIARKALDLTSDRYTANVLAIIVAPSGYRGLCGVVKTPTPPPAHGTVGKACSRLTHALSEADPPSEVPAPFVHAVPTVGLLPMTTRLAA